MTYSIKGVVVNEQSLNPINGAKVSISPITFVFTDTNGNFIIKGNTPESGSISMTIDVPGFQFTEPAIYKGDNTLKTDLGVIQLQPIISSLPQEKLSSSQLSRVQIEELSKGNKGADYFTQERLSNQIIDLKKTLIPSVLTMLAAFGITGASKLILKDQDKILDVIENKSKCPPEETLTSLIDKKNKLVKQLNNTLKIINITTKSLGITTGLISLINKSTATQKIALSTIPTSTGVPGIPGVPIGTITEIDDTKDNNKKLVEKLSYVSVGITSTLILLEQTLIQATQLLQLLDKLIEKCYPNTEQEKVTIELTALTNEQSQQLSPVVTNVNGFTMGVETEITNKPLKRRRATATNKQNVVMLRGEWSFSSIDQILIDELIFYIQQNNLKAD
jgi:hypothetical protein